MKTQWAIDRVTDEEDQRFVGTVGPYNATLSHEEIRKHPQRQKFRLLTDDRDVIAYGSMIGDNMFAPLDDFGEPNWGCTIIEYREDGEWVIL